MLDIFGSAKISFDDVSTEQFETCDGRRQPDSRYFMCCSPYCYCYALDINSWIVCLTDHISDIIYDKNPLSTISCDNIKLDMIVKIIKQHLINERSSKPIIINNRNRGKIFLLHGPPGCGKTMTSEIVAEYFKLPLLNVNLGDLYSTPANFSEKLKENFELAQRWNAIMLIDEADTIMQQRDNNMKNNVYTSIFLKEIEFYTGIIFMTTNRLQIIDEAFRSRISLIVKYNQLDAKGREFICDSIMKKLQLASTTVKNMVVSAEHLNGRDILNILQNYHAISADSTPMMSDDNDDSVIDLTTITIMNGLIGSTKSDISTIHSDKN